ncbi:MAG: hypothetical protein HC927_07155 [Deltaproteobacteria bacterium]|nr:hypothetical protein [Deltaproteobacteria bacterium]
MAHETGLPQGRLLSVPALATAGRTGLRISAGLIDEEFLKELRGKAKDRVYNEMFLNSPVIGGSIWLIEALIRQVKWTFDQPLDRDADPELVDFYNSCMHDMESPFSTLISECRDMLVHGFLPVEMLFKLRRGAHPMPQLRSRHNDGLVGWRDLSPRSPDSRDEWVLDPETNDVIGLVQQIDTDSITRTIPGDKLLMFRLRSSKHNPEGISLLRHAYFPYFMWRKLSEIEAIGVERNVAGYPMMTAPIEAWDPTNAAHNVRQDLEKMIKLIRQHELAGVVLPGARSADGDTGWSFQLIGSSGSSKSETDLLIQRYRSDQALALLTQFILLGQQGVGSFSLASDQSSMLTVALGALLDAIADEINRKAVPLLGRLNGFDPDRLPILTHGDVEKADVAQFVAAISSMIQSGVIVPHDVDEDAVRTMLELPARDAGTPRTQPGSEALPAELDLFAGQLAGSPVNG